MTDAVSHCDDHGYFEGASCPVCNARGDPLISGERRRRLSKFVSGALRHFPDDAGVDLDGAGWTTRAELVAAVESKYDWASGDHLDAVVATDPKGRFEGDEREGEPALRAAYGHSVDVDLDATDDPVPATLYHGTAPRNLDPILSGGLEPMGRQQVHLSGSRADAREVGARHADDPVVLSVNAAAMQADGHDVVKRGRSTYSTDRVPPAYLERVD
jgi:putative RNA 2'-phosphotransferase